MITFIPRDKVSKNWIIIAPILSIVFTIFFGLLIFTFLGYNPIETLYQIFISPFSRIDRISDILVKACPLIIIGTGLMLCFKSNVWNIGAEGQFIMGALLAGFIALSFPNIETKSFKLDEHQKIEQFIDYAHEKLGGLDILVNKNKIDSNTIAERVKHELN